MATVAAQDPTNVLDQRIQWAISMRQKFSPSGMMNEDGSVNQDFFKPKRVVIVNERRWGEAEKEALYKGLEKYGVGKWREIGAEFLQGWEDQQIRIRASRLLGSQSLVRYVAWKGNKEAVDREYAKNKQIGEATGCWKNGTLVENDNGDVKKYMEKLEAEGKM